MNYFNYQMMLPLTFGLVASTFLYIGLRGLVKRKPFLMPSRWIIFMMIPILLPGFSLPFMVHQNPGFDLITWADPLLLILIFTLYWKITKGYSVYGANAETIRKSLLAAINELNLQYTENMTGIYLPAHDITLTASVAMSIGKISVKGKDTGGLLKRVAVIMKKEFANSDFECDLKPFLFFLAIGVMILITACKEVSLLQEIGTHYTPNP